MYVCMLCMCVCYVCVYVVYVLYVHMFVCMFVRAYVCKCVCLYVCYATPRCFALQTSNFQDFIYNPMVRSWSARLSFFIHPTIALSMNNQIALCNYCTNCPQCYANNYIQVLTASCVCSLSVQRYITRHYKTLL